MRVLAVGRNGETWVVTEEESDPPQVVRVIGGLNLRGGYGVSGPLQLDGILTQDRWRPPEPDEVFPDFSGTLAAAPQGPPEPPHFCRNCGFPWSKGGWVIEDYCDVCTTYGGF